MEYQKRGFAPSSTPLPEEGKAFWLLGSLVVILLTSEQTHNAFALQLITHPIGTEPPPHIHREQDEIFCVLEGSATVICGDQTWSVSPGDYVFLPRGVLHSFKIRGTMPLKLEVITSPGSPLGFEHLVEALGEPTTSLTLPPAGPLDLQRVITLAAQYGVEIPM